MSIGTLALKVSHPSCTRFLLDISTKPSGSKRAVYVVLGISRQGDKELLGLWLGEAETEGAKFWALAIDRMNPNDFTAFPSRIHPGIHQRQVLAQRVDRLEEPRLTGYSDCLL